MSTSSCCLNGSSSEPSRIEYLVSRLAKNSDAATFCGKPDCENCLKLEEQKRIIKKVYITPSIPVSVPYNGRIKLPVARNPNTTLVKANYTHFHNQIEINLSPVKLQKYSFIRKALFDLKHTAVPDLFSKLKFNSIPFYVVKFANYKFKKSMTTELKLFQKRKQEQSNSDEGLLFMIDWLRDVSSQIGEENLFDAIQLANERYERSHKKNYFQRLLKY